MEIATIIINFPCFPGMYRYAVQFGGQIWFEFVKYLLTSSYPLSAFFILPLVSLLSSPPLSVSLPFSSLYDI